MKSKSYQKKIIVHNLRQVSTPQKAWYFYLHLYIFALIYIEFGCKVVIYNQITGLMRGFIFIILSAPLLIRLILHGVPVENLKLIILLTLVILLNSLRDLNSINYLMLYTSVAIGFLVASAVNFTQFSKVFCNVVCFLALVSLLCFFLSIAAPQFVSRFPFLGYRYDSYAQVHDMYLSVVLTNCEVYRNMGLTWEPGAFAILLGLALLFCIAYDYSHKKVMIGLLLITILTTFSTLGYIILSIIFFIELLRHTTESQLRKVCIGALILIIVLFVFSYTNAGQIVFGKLKGLFSGSESDIALTTSVRLDAIYYPAMAFISSPIIGIGYDKFYILNMTLCNGMAVNTIMNWFALGGVVLGLPCLVFYLRAVVALGKQMDLNAVSMIILCGGSILLVSTQSLLRISLIYIIIFYGCAFRKPKRRLNL